MVTFRIYYLSMESRTQWVELELPDGSTEEDAMSAMYADENKDAYYDVFKLLYAEQVS